MQSFKETADRIREEVGRVIIGQKGVVDQLLIALLAGGHVLLEGVPGVGKTLLVKTLCRCVDARFKRIQFTPDLMPADVLGTNVFDLQKNEFTLRKGPIFTDVLLADEINRTPPKTQAALLEAMQEKQATIDGASHGISPVFFVCATQNPVEFEGTYPLPEAQLDRFLMNVRMDYPEYADECSIVRRYAATPALDADPINAVRPVLNVEQLVELRRGVNQVQVEARIVDYVVQIAAATRKLNSVSLGASPRASLALLHCAKAAAAIDGQDYITPDHVKQMAAPVLRHRLFLLPEAEVEGQSVDNLVRHVLDSVTVPR
jgi:MoxR-like ATPase